MSARKLTIRTAIACITLILALARGGFAAQTVLEQYVNEPDDAFEYELVKTAYTFLYTTYIFEVTSQRWHEGDWAWHSEDFETDGKWKHWLRIIEPRLFGRYTENIPFFSLVQHDTALLYLLRGDAEHENRPSGATFTEALPALMSRSIIAELDGVPIGPVSFNDEDEDNLFCRGLKEIDLDKYADECTEPRIEDSLQARSFDLALATEDFTWALMAPMTKAAVRGMDVVQEFLRGRYWGREVIKKFVLTGHSKRGHIVWLTAALDDRVAAIAPVSFDLLNLNEQIALQDASWPARSEEQDANLEFDLYERYKTPVGQSLIADVDPFYYLGPLAGVPSLTLVATGDPYSCSDAAALYIDDLLADSWLHYVPNTGHDIRLNPEVESAITNFYRHAISGRELPEFSWTGLEAGTFTVLPLSGGLQPASAKLWQATNTVNRDFRYTGDPAEPQWTATVLEPNADGAYKGTVDKPASGATAYFVELIYQENEQEGSYSFATPITLLEP